jgi:hypothetical protein
VQNEKEQLYYVQPAYELGIRKESKNKPKISDDKVGNRKHTSFVVGI